MRVVIIGGGAAGMMCAATLNEQLPRTEVILLEKNESLGKKVLISGGGRCNVTTGIHDVKQVLEYYPRGHKFLTSSMHRFPPAAVYDWFERNGVSLKCEDDLRVFPVSDDGKDVVRVFERIFTSGNTTVKTKQTVKKIEKVAGGFNIFTNDQPVLHADAVVLALGGQAYRHTGSTGDGYTFAEALGHHITPLAPSLNSFITAEKWPKQLAGISFPKATIRTAGAKAVERTGPFLFTHHGISGPAVFALSSLVAFENYTIKNPLAIFIDFVPEVAAEHLHSDLRNFCESNPKKDFKTTLHQYIPRALVELFGKEFKLPIKKNNAEVSTAELDEATDLLKQLPLHVVLRGAGDEFVTAGGIDLAKINPQTMESTLCPNLYFAGEILAVDGFTGGFNLQAAWATGRAAGESIAKK